MTDSTLEPTGSDPSLHAPEASPSVGGAGSVVMRAVGHVQSPRTEPIDDDWDGITATIHLDPSQFTEDSLEGLDAFSHIEVVYVFDRVEEQAITTAARHPRGNRDWPMVGVFAQRAKGRPNRIGVSICNLIRVEGLQLTVRALDAIDGSPVLDIKPYMQEFAPRGEIRQPDWSRELMAGYWSCPEPLKDR